MAPEINKTSEKMKSVKAAWDKAPSGLKKDAALKHYQAAEKAQTARNDAIRTRNSTRRHTRSRSITVRAPKGFSPDPMTDLPQKSARNLVAQAIAAELNAFLAAHSGQTDADGRRRLVRHAVKTMPSPALTLWVTPSIMTRPLPSSMRKN